MRRAIAAGLLLGLWALGAGCASSTRVQVSSRRSTNSGEPVHMMLRSGDQIELEEPYEAAARRMFTREDDPQRLERQVIIPGTTFSVSLTVPEGEDLGVYFFFTDYEEKKHRFRVVVSRTKLPAEIFIELGDDEIVDSTYRRR